MRRLLSSFILVCMIVSSAHSQGVVITLFDFNGDFQGWELVQRSQYGDKHLCGGNMLSSWIGWDVVNSVPKDPSLPAGTELRFQSPPLGNYCQASEFLVDVYYYFLPWNSPLLPLQARLYLLTGSGSNYYFGQWFNLVREPTLNLISLPVSGIPDLNDIQAIGVAFRSSVNFRGKVKIDNVRVHVIPEPTTLVLLGIGLGALVGTRQFSRKRKKFFRSGRHKRLN